MSTEKTIKIQYFHRKIVILAFFCLYMIPFGVFICIRTYEYFTRIDAEITRFEEFCFLTVAKGNMKHPPGWDMPCEKAKRFQDRDPNSTDFSGLPDWPIRNIYPAAIVTLAIPFDGATIERKARLRNNDVILARTAKAISVRPLQQPDHELVTVLDHWHFWTPILVFLTFTSVLALGVYFGGQKHRS